MVSILMLALSILSAYLIGSFPTSFIMAKIFKGIDIRDVGSKNAGATNVLRTVGKIPAVITLVVDALKGVFAVTAVAGFFYAFGIDLVYDFYRCLLGLVVVCGHIWSVFLKFKGGKGIATTLGVAVALAPKILLPSAVIWFLVFSLTSYVSLASILSLISFPVISAIFGGSLYVTLLSVILCVITIYKHKENIKRLMRGEENKTQLFTKNKPS
ncbi:MAG: glycerol-3-phosphate 1-O-acyltransferase PlsY [Candidatus Omnitrophica bacterium]|nr:glycerol-3-phosphate 1-O-acyltransferase PlsY [Candidatus Omnitrophota bacterium]